MLCSIKFFNPLQQEILVSVSNLHKSFKNFKAVDGLSFTVNKGDIYGFLGPNGAGKSTTIRMMVSLIKSDSGEISIFNKTLDKHRSEILNKTGALIERPDFYKYLSAAKNLEILARLSGVRITKSRIYELLEMVGLKNREASKAQTFSQGMKQRLGLAQALLHDPELLILDEPSNGLDPQGIKEMRELIVMLNKEQGKTILLSSHLLSEIELMANRMIIINRGKAVVEGDVAELLQNGNVNVVYEVNNIEAAIACVQKLNEFTKIKTENNFITIEMHQKDAARVNSIFVNNNIEVKSIKPLRALEEYFLSLT